MREELLCAITSIIEVLEGEGELIIAVRISAERMEELAAIRAELEDFEEDGHTEAELTTDGWSA